MFAPNGLGVREELTRTSSVDASGYTGAIAPFGQGYLHVQSRLRVTRDGGCSILAVDDLASTTRLERASARGPGLDSLSESESRQARQLASGRTGGTSIAAELPSAVVVAPLEMHHAVHSAPSVDPYIKVRPQ